MGEIEQRVIIYKYYLNHIEMGFFIFSKAWNALLNSDFTTNVSVLFMTGKILYNYFASFH